jgi:hypothetical protein
VTVNQFGRERWQPIVLIFSPATSRPSAKPASLKPRRNAATDSAHSLAVALPRSPITGIAFCCARAASGQAAVAPPSRVMNSRRLMLIFPGLLSVLAAPPP